MSTEDSKKAPPSLADLVLPNSSSIADRVKSFLPLIAKANEQLENGGEEETKLQMIEQLEQLSDSEEEEDDDDDSAEEDAEEERKADASDDVKSDFVSITFHKIAQPDPDESSDGEDDDESLSKAKAATYESNEEEEDFVIRRHVPTKSDP